MMSTHNALKGMPPHHKPCPKCGQPMHRQSNLCQDCYKALHAHPENYVTRRCKHCNKEYTIHIAQTRNGQGNYCSRFCARIGKQNHRRTRIAVSCTTCGKTFERHLAEIKKIKGDKHFCSSDCWYTYNQRDHHFLWSGGQDERMNPESSKWRRAVLKRDKGVCRVCHATDNLEVHHILPFRSHPTERWDVDNGITLCHDCHIQTYRCELEYVEELKIIASLELNIWIYHEYEEDGDLISYYEVL